MLPVVRGERATAASVLRYAAVLVAVTVAPAVTGTFGLVYLVVAMALGGTLLVLAVRLRAQTTLARASVLFHYSLLYLALLFAAVALDAVIRG
jgi:protoheme IX farnesyltransferase